MVRVDVPVQGMRPLQHALGMLLIKPHNYSMYQLDISHTLNHNVNLELDKVTAVGQLIL